MTRIRKTLVSVLAICAVTAAFSSTAMAADSTSVNALVGDQGPAVAEPGGYSSPTAIIGGEEVGPTRADYSSVNAIVGDRPVGHDDPARVGASEGSTSLNSIVGADGVTSPSPVSAPSAGTTDGFDWTDALVGAAVVLGLALCTVLLLATMRRRTRIEPI